MKLMIVDDDDQIREGMAYGIQWENLGIQQVLCCRNGQEALTELGKAPFDIVITDISMPVMSGIDLMKSVRQKNPDIAFILISGYKEFEYAQAGIRYGAQDYILKPIHLDELIDIVTRVIQEIEQHREDSRNRDTQRKMERDRKMKHILSGELKEEPDIRRYLSEDCGFGKVHALLGVVLHGEEDALLLEEGKYSPLLTRKLTEYLAGYTYMYSNISPGEVFLIIDVADSTLQIWHLQQQIARMAAGINRETEDSSYWAGVSEIGYVKDLPHLYESAKKALELRWFQEDNRCFFFRDYQSHSGDGLCTEEWNQRLIQQLETGNVKETEALAARCKKELYRQTREEVQKFIFQNVVQTIRHFKKLTLDDGIQEQIFASETFENAISVWYDFLHDVLELQEEETKYSKEICRALSYIRAHYMKKITAEGMAEYLGISSGHFSRIFKQQLGISFVKYLNQYRMDRAEELLLDTGLKVYEVAEKVGIPDYIYFTQVFKNIKGTAPTDVRR